MNKTLFTFAVAAAFTAGSAFAATDVLTENFDTRALGLIAGQGTWASGGNDLSEVKEGNGGRYLELKTEGDVLTNTLASASVANDAIDNGEAVVFESEIKFVPSDTADCGLVGGTDDTKFAIFAYAQDNGPTNLVVFHCASDAGVYTNEVIDVDGALDDPDAYTKVTVKVFDGDGDGLFFTVALNDGDLLEHSLNDYSDPNGDYAKDPTWFKTVNNESNDANKEFSAICFKGTGAVDNIKVTTEASAQDDWVDDPSTIVAGTDAATQYPQLDGTAIADADAKDLTIWADANGIAFADVVADADNYVDAFLLNCDPADVVTEAEEFVLTITIENGTVVIEAPAGKTYNVEPQLKGSNDLSTWYDIDASETDDYKFFKAELSL